ncbi:inorganic polyphosphate/ATP-NAD kinase [Acidilobus saccharovorans 345-15]|uniref:NAD kinase n=1 Tax=Acidilobus saccharovorans (strain DSM 16705 / JCM 18335 / VKM B-2471 / 345-15) TaxID=666510 RepID=D9Q0G7_ACIS3|nr:NAD(+)/NADH kinase [Acidilobus saccharovorans]ADL18805.1 inorganic polyphosphate/ATP-NAD kinase [Acidilobus saccharovorans 345-15]
MTEREAVGIVARPSSGIAEGLALKAAEVLRQLGVEPLVEAETAAAYSNTLGKLGTFNIERDPPHKVIVIGGDGTLLRAAIRSGSNEVVFLAVRAGKRGFLLDVDESVLSERIRDFVNDKYELVLHQRIKAYVNGNQLPCAVNDVVIFTSEGSMVRLDVYHDEEKLRERVMGVDGDGLIISTTTGSTAYSLNAGGPIVDPRLDVIIITPLNPVQLFLRPVVMSRSNRLSIIMRDESGPAYLVLDGQVKVNLRPGDRVNIYPCEVPLKVARFEWWSNYYERLFARLLSYW